MGLTYAAAVAYGQTGKHDMKLLVDTGALYTWLSKELLQKIGVQPMGKRRFRTIEGKILQRDVGEVKIECLDESASCIVVFGEAGDAEVMGVTTLENLGLEVDPTMQQVRKAEALAAY